MEKGEGGVWWMKGGKTKKRDSYYRAGCRGRLFSPSSLCGPEDNNWRIGRESELNPTKKQTQCTCDYLNLRYKYTTLWGWVAQQHHKRDHCRLKPKQTRDECESAFSKNVHVIFIFIFKCHCCVIRLLYCGEDRLEMSHTNNWVEMLSFTKPRYVGKPLRKCRQAVTVTAISNCPYFLIKALKDNTLICLYTASKYHPSTVALQCFWVTNPRSWVLYSSQGPTRTGSNLWNMKLTVHQRSVTPHL